jgi:hypothetical protein
MTKIASLTIAALLGLSLLVAPAERSQAQDRAPEPAASAPAVAGGAEILLYRFPGVRDDGGGDNVGVATSFHCTNFSGVNETIRIVVRNGPGVLLTNTVVNISHLQTQTISTHFTRLYAEVGLNTGLVSQGTAAIAATSTSSPIGIALRGVRFNPIPGSQE